MTENELQLKRDILIAVNKLIPPTFANDVSVPIESVIDSALPIIRSYANGLVAAAVSECAKKCEELYETKQYVPMSRELACAKAIRSTVTSESAAKELERIKQDSLEEGLQYAVKVLQGAKAIGGKYPEEIRAELERIQNAVRLDELEALFKFWDIEGVKDGDVWNLLIERIAELKAAKEK